MGFRENLKKELAYKGMLVKELSEKSGVPKGTIDHYLAEKYTEPIAINAVKIAKVLNVTVEYLVTGEIAKTEIENELYKKYVNLLQKIDKLENPSKSILEQLINQLK